MQFGKMHGIALTVLGFIGEKIAGKVQKKIGQVEKVLEK
jgi:hypothetical protein